MIRLFQKEFATVQEVSVKQFTFPGGEPHVKISDPIHLTEYLIVAKITSAEDVITLMLLKDALSPYNVPVTLLIPYFPGARQDRRMVEGEPFTAKVFANLINDMMFHQVFIFDPHSDVITALLDDVNVIDNHDFVKRAITQTSLPQNSIIVSPDAGSNKKVYGLIKTLGNYNLVKCDKQRDTSNGNITGFEVYADDLGGNPCVIVDDICDGGGTFIGLAKELQKKNSGSLHLIVSHGIFSKGFSDLAKYFDTITYSSSLSVKEGTGVIEKEGKKTIINRLLMFEEELEHLL